MEKFVVEDASISLALALLSVDARGRIFVPRTGQTGYHWRNEKSLTTEAGPFDNAGLPLNASATLATYFAAAFRREAMNPTSPRPSRATDPGSGTFDADDVTLIDAPFTNSCQPPQPMLLPNSCRRAVLPLL